MMYLFSRIKITYNENFHWPFMAKLMSFYAENNRYLIAFMTLKSIVFQNKKRLFIFAILFFLLYLLPSLVY